MKFKLLTSLFLSSLIFSDVSAFDVDKCLETAETNEQMSACWSQDEKEADAKLNKLYKELQGNCEDADEPQKCLAALKQMQRDWIKVREETRDYIYNYGLYAGGSNAQLDAQVYFVDELKNRVKVLQNIKCQVDCEE